MCSLEQIMPQDLEHLSIDIGALEYNGHRLAGTFLA
jgi:hypothetical protein